MDFSADYDIRLTDPNSNLWKGTLKEKKEAETLGKDSCCCGATKENPCECMYKGIMNCSAVEPKCPCYAEKDAGAKAEAYTRHVTGDSQEAGKMLKDRAIRYRLKQHQRRLADEILYEKYGSDRCIFCVRLIDEQFRKGEITEMELWEGLNEQSDEGFLLFPGQLDCELHNYHYAESFSAEEESVDWDHVDIEGLDFDGHDKCVECGAWEIPMSEMDGGEIGLTDYFFSCADCNFSWYVAIRTNEHEDGPSVGSEDAGWFYGERGLCDGCARCEDDEGYHLKVIEAYQQKEAFEAPKTLTKGQAKKQFAQILKNHFIEELTEIVDDYGRRDVEWLKHLQALIKNPPKCWNCKGTGIEEGFKRKRCYREKRETCQDGMDVGEVNDAKEQLKEYADKDYDFRNMGDAYWPFQYDINQLKKNNWAGLTTSCDTIVREEIPEDFYDFAQTFEGNVLSWHQDELGLSDYFDDDLTDDSNWSFDWNYDELLCCRKTTLPWSRWRPADKKLYNKYIKINQAKATEGDYFWEIFELDNSYEKQVLHRNKASQMKCKYCGPMLKKLNNPVQWPKHLFEYVVNDIGLPTKVKKQIKSLLPIIGGVKPKPKPKTKSKSKKTKAKAGRKAPTISATRRKIGTRMRGNDGKMWQVKKAGKSQRWMAGAESFGDDSEVYDIHLVYDDEDARIWDVFEYGKQIGVIVLYYHTNDYDDKRLGRKYWVFILRGGDADGLEKQFSPNAFRTINQAKKAFIEEITIYSGYEGWEAESSGAEAPSITVIMSDELKNCPFCSKDFDDDWWDALWDSSDWVTDEGGVGEFYREIWTECPHCGEDFGVQDASFPVGSWFAEPYDDSMDFGAEGIVHEDYTATETFAAYDRKYIDSIRNKPHWEREILLEDPDKGPNSGEDMPDNVTRKCPKCAKYGTESRGSRVYRYNDGLQCFDFKDCGCIHYDHSIRNRRTKKVSLIKSDMAWKKRTTKEREESKKPKKGKKKKRWWQVFQFWKAESLSAEDTTSIWGMQPDDNPDVQWITDPNDPEGHTIAVPAGGMPPPTNGTGGDGGTEGNGSQEESNGSSDEGQQEPQDEQPPPHEEEQGGGSVDALTAEDKSKFSWKNKRLYEDSISQSDRWQRIKDGTPRRTWNCGKCYAKGFIDGKECLDCYGKGFWMMSAPKCATCDIYITDDWGVDGTRREGMGAYCNSCESWYCDDHILHGMMPHHRLCMVCEGPFQRRHRAAAETVGEDEEPKAETVANLMMKNELLIESPTGEDALWLERPIYDGVITFSISEFSYMDEYEYEGAVQEMIAEQAAYETEKQLSELIEDIGWEVDVEAEMDESIVSMFGESEYEETASYAFVHFDDGTQLVFAFYCEVGEVWMLPRDESMMVNITISGELEQITM